MCSDPDSKPPIEAQPASAASGRRVQLTASDGKVLSAYQAEATAPSGAGILVLPDYYGLTPFYEELALRFAELGTDAIVVDYYGRTAPPPPRDASFDPVGHAERTTWSGLQADAGAAAEHLRRERGLGSLFSIGFCFGGRTSFLLGTLPELGLAGVIGFYGWPVGHFANDTPAPADVTGRLVAPLLGIFGGADPKITSADAQSFERALGRATVPHRVVTYEGAPHSFFDRKQLAYADAAAAAWTEVQAFIATHRTRTP